MAAVGRKTWAIAEGYIPGKSTGPAPAMTSHEAMCFLNAGERDAHLQVTIFFEDREPVVVQHTRLDSRQDANALLSTIAYPVD